MIIDNGAPLSLTGTPWLNKYLKDNNITREDLAKDEVKEHFRFGPCEVYIATEKFKIPIMSPDTNGKNIKMIVNAFEVQADVPLLCGKNTLSEWGAITNHKDNSILCQNVVEHEEVHFKLIQTERGHDALKLHTVKKDSIEKTVSYIC